MLSTFQKIAASSTAAIRNSLRNRKMALLHKQRLVQQSIPFMDERFIGEYEESQLPFEFQRQFIANEIEEIEKLLAMKVDEDIKTVELIRFIKKMFKEISDPAQRKIVIFTEYLATQDHLIDTLEREFGPECSTKINGSLDVDQRRSNQKKFRDDDSVSFLVSTESGGEGINLQFSHILFNYDMPWNPMRIEQRVGRIYRYGQTKVVQVYNFRTQDTIEDTIYDYIGGRLERAAKALSKVTGEDVDEIVASMYGEMENEIDYDSIYMRSLVAGDIEESKEEIDRGIDRARRAYELATQELFEDVSAYSFDSYEKQLKTELTLKDLESFTRKFIEHKRRKVEEDDGIYSFITPDDMLGRQVANRYENVTFDRKRAIDESQLDFFAVGHPFVDAMIRLCGSVEFGGHTTTRVMENKQYAGATGIQFNYIIRSRVQRGEEEEFLFDMYTVFVDHNYEVNDSLAQLSQRSYSQNRQSQTDGSISMDVGRAGAVADAYLRENVEVIWDWDEDVELLNVALVQVR